MTEINEENIIKQYILFTKKMIDNSITISTMESCTAGLIASLLTNCEGSSKALNGAFITYSNRAKIMNGVPGKILYRYGVYSLETAEAMANACRKTYNADIGIGITGTFGNPDPNNHDSISNVVYISIVSEFKANNVKIEIPPQDTRWDYKLYVAQAILNSLYKILLLYEQKIN